MGNVVEHEVISAKNNARMHNLPRLRQYVPTGYFLVFKKSDGMTTNLFDSVKLVN